MRCRISVFLFICLILFSSAELLQAQKQYNIRKFSIYVPSGWKLYDHDVDNLVVTSTEIDFSLSFLVIDSGDEEVKWKAILRSLGESYDFNEELSDQGGMNLDNGLHITYKFCDIVNSENRTKQKFVWAQVDNDKDYTILIFGISQTANFGYYKSSLWKIFENINYKEE